MFDFIPAASYSTIFYNLVLILSIIKCLQISNSNKSIFLLLCIFLIIFIGGRPISGSAFGDSVNYAVGYEKMKYVVYVLGHKEWLFYNTMSLFARSGLDVNVFFTFVAFVYIGFQAWACVRLFGNNGYLAFLLVMGAFSFWGFGTNGIRNGMAAAVMMLALTYVDSKKLLAALLAYVSVSIHTSMLLPVACIIASLFYNNSKHYFYFWLISIILSVIAGGTISNFFLSIGLVEDDRFDAYLTGGFDDKFSNTGFRWDFLMYSCVPIIIGFYYISKYKFEDKVFKTLFNTYILANSFWVMVIRASFSNRFAYLSWFLYGVVLIYPFLKCEDIPGRQKKIRMVLLGSALFTYTMWQMGKLF